jgi:hypothetical protein
MVITIGWALEADRHTQIPGNLTQRSYEVFVEVMDLEPVMVIIAPRRRRYSTLCAFYRWFIGHEIVEINPM